MKNVEEYARYAQEPFDRRPITAGDGLVFSAIAYDDFSRYNVKLPAKVTEYNDVRFCRPIMHACAVSKRFSDVVVLRQKNVFTSQPHCQFSGTACRAGNVLFVSYCGTDETVSGWLEDFNIISNLIIPAQKYAADFLNEVAREFNGDIYLSGHSKGGNCAVYAAAFCNQEIKKRIKRVYNFDGPGFLPEIRYKQEYKETLPKVEKFVPRMSFFGMFLLGSEKVFPTKCHGFWFLQHDHYAWIINQDGSMPVKKNLSPLAKKSIVVFHRIISALSKKEREYFAKIAEDALTYAGVTSMYAMPAISLLKLIKYLLTLKNPQEKSFARWLLRELIFCTFSLIK